MGQIQHKVPSNVPFSIICVSVGTPLCTALEMIAPYVWIKLWPIDICTHRWWERIHEVSQTRFVEQSSPLDHLVVTGDTLVDRGWWSRGESCAVDSTSSLTPGGQGCRQGKIEGQSFGIVALQTFTDTMTGGDTDFFCKEQWMQGDNKNRFSLVNILFNISIEPPGIWESSPEWDCSEWRWRLGKPRL